MKNALFYFGAGALAALIQSLLMWQLGQVGIVQSLHVAIAPALTAHWLYPKIVWGGIWALLFLLPMQDSRYLLKGSIISLFPTIVQLFVVYPFFQHKGFGGLQLGYLTPFYILFINWLWGIMAVLIIRLAK